MRVKEESEKEHQVGNKDCPICWKDAPPFECIVCGGLVHSEYLSGPLGSAEILYRCDKCGSAH